MKKFALYISCLLVLAAFGCNKGGGRPADLPEDMSPCAVTIIQDGQPLAGASVQFEYDTPVKYTTSGVTDEKGVAIMMTYGQPGAQQGTAKVCVSKLVTEGGSEGEEYGGHCKPCLSDPLPVPGGLSHLPERAPEPAGLRRGDPHRGRHTAAERV